MCYRDRASLRDTTSRKREILFFPVAREKCQRPLTQIRLWPKKARIKLINYTGSSPSVGSRPNCLDFRDPDIYFSPMSRMLRLREREFPVDTKDNLNVLLSERTYRGKFSIVHLSGQDPYSPWDMVSRYHRDPRFLLSQTNSGNWLWKVIFIRYRGGEGHFLPRHLFFLIAEPAYSSRGRSLFIYFVEANRGMKCISSRRNRVNVGTIIKKVK